MLDWSTYLEYLQPILLKYKLVEAQIKPTMLKYFWKGLKPFILAKLKYQNLKLESFNQIIKEPVDSKAKAAFWPYFNTWEMNQHYLYNTQPANSISAKSQKIVWRTPR